MLAISLEFSDHMHHIQRAEIVNEITRGLPDATISATIFLSCVAFNRECPSKTYLWRMCETFVFKSQTTLVTNIVGVYIPNSIEEATVVVRDDSSYDNSFRIQ